MTAVCHKLGLKVVKVKETSSGESKTVAGSPDVKGVRGTDKRKYLIDMLRLHPRDLNYPDKETQSACVIR